MNKDFEQAFIDDWNAGNVRNVATGELVVPKREWVGLTDEEILEAERLASIRHHKHKYSIRGQQITPADDPQWH